MTELRTPQPLPYHNVANFKFVYPTLSRRSKGISIGVNLNPDKVCNFDCIYCQVGACLRMIQRMHTEMALES